MADDKWLFPIRMESKNGIVRKENIVECFGAFKKPVDQLSWDKLLRAGSIAAEDPSNQPLLEQWWTIGWKETPQLPAMKTKPIPTLKLRETMDGWEPDIMYANLKMAAKYENTRRDVIETLAAGVWTKLKSDARYILYRDFSHAAIKARQNEAPPWTHFAADNRILGHYHSGVELAKDLNIRYVDVYIAHKENWNELSDGTWIWYENWGIMPISPQDELLGFDWREKYGANFGKTEEDT